VLFIVRKKHSTKFSRRVKGNMVVNNREVKITAGEGAHKNGYCQCNGCKTKRYTAATAVFTMLIAIGIWVSIIF